MSPIVRLVPLVAVLSCLASLRPTLAEEPRAPVRGILLSPERVTPETLRVWNDKGATDVLVPLDTATKPRWGALVQTVEQAGLSLWPWVEVARSRELADAHPEWMAAIGAHHDDWRRRFPNAPEKKPGEVIKAWPWVPIGYVAAFDAHRERLKTLLKDLPGNWRGVFLNDLQAGPSSCGCGNDQCRWALDYGSPPTAAKTPGDDVAARLVAEVARTLPGKTVVPVWVTECETQDLPEAKNGTGLCGGVGCARGDCWPRYVRAWNPLVKATNGPIALAVWSETFQRDATKWPEESLALFQTPPREGTMLRSARTIAVIQAWGKPEPVMNATFDRVKRTGAGWVFALDPVDQSWEPRSVRVPQTPR